MPFVYHILDKAVVGVECVEGAQRHGCSGGEHGKPPHPNPYMHIYVGS